MYGFVVNDVTVTVFVLGGAEHQSSKSLMISFANGPNQSQILLEGEEFDLRCFVPGRSLGRQGVYVSADCHCSRHH
jgi:hypothetical protein